MKKYIASIFIAFGVTLSANAQLANGSIAPDFNLVDINGNTHHLYDYLSQGKAVVLEFFACHCPTCWNYHQAGKLDSLNEAYGPDGTNQIVTLMIEYDESNGANEFNGTGGWTAGDWVTGNSVPMINVEGADRSIFTDYDMVYFTQLYKICPDKTTELMNTAHSVSDFFQAADDCVGELSVDENQNLSGTIHVDYSKRQLILSDFEDVATVHIINSIGQQIQGIAGKGNQVIDISKLTTGMYFVQIETHAGSLVEKIFIP
jgi:thiol-disulfide isomerase/thioredoxin